MAGPEARPHSAALSLRALLADLFPLSPERQAATAATRWAVRVLQVAAVAAGALLMLGRIGGKPVWDSVYAEDYTIFLPGALAHPWHLLQGYTGYLQLVPRLIAQLVALLPIRDAGAGFAVISALVTAACGLFTYHASAGHLGSRWLRALLGLSVVLLPVAQLEIADNGANTPYYLLAALFWAALWRPRSRAGWWAAALVGCAAASSNPLALVFAPLLAARAVVLPRRLREHGVTAGWAAGSALQLLVMLTSHQSRTTAAPGNAVAYYAHEVILPALGWHLSWGLRTAFGVPGATLIVGAFLTVVLGAAVATQTRQCRVFVLTAVATGLVYTAVAATQSVVAGQQVTLARETGARYSAVPILLLDAAMIVAADACARRWRPSPRAVAAMTALVAVLAAGWITDYRYPVARLNGQWAAISSAWLRHCEDSPDGSIAVANGAWFSKHPPVITFSCGSLRR
jgi:hypothetical protein